MTLIIHIKFKGSQFNKRLHKMNNNMGWGSALTLLGLVWFIVSDKQPAKVPEGTGPIVERITKRNLPAYIVTQLVISKIVDGLTPNPPQMIIAPPSDQPSGSSVLEPLPFTPDIPVNPDGMTSITVECYKNEKENECFNRILEQKDAVFNDMDDIIGSSINEYKKIQEKFNQDYVACDEKVTSVAPLNDYLLTYDLQIYCMVNKGHQETLDKLSENSSTLKNRLDNLDNNKEILSSYLNSVI